MGARNRVFISRDREVVDKTSIVYYIFFRLPDDGDLNMKLKFGSRIETLILYIQEF